MRIISGELGGRLIRGPKGEATRPITDRVKTNLFNILAPRLEGAVVADCFCGTGSLGIEALSRGARLAVFAEIEASALRLLRENIDELALAERARIVRHDVLRRGLPPNDAPFSLVFLDPPYRTTETQADRLWLKICESADDGRLANDAIVVWRHDSRLKLSVPDELAGRLRIDDLRTYGSQSLVFIRM